MAPRGIAPRPADDSLFTNKESSQFEAKPWLYTRMKNPCRVVQRRWGGASVERPGHKAWLNNDNVRNDTARAKRAANSLVR